MDVPLQTIGLTAAVLQWAVNRLDVMMCLEEAEAAMHQDRSCMCLFWAMAYWMREHRCQPDPKQLLRDLLSPNPSRLATSTLCKAFAILAHSVSHITPTPTWHRERQRSDIGRMLNYLYTRRLLQGVQLLCGFPGCSHSVLITLGRG